MQAREAVELLQNELRMPFGERCESLDGAQEVPIGAQLDRQAEPGQLLLKPPVAGLQSDQPFRTKSNRPATDLVGKIPAIVRVGKLAVENVAPLTLLLIAKMTHRREEEGKAAFVLRDVGCFFADLHLQDGVLPRVEAIEGGRLAVELVAKDQDEMAQLHRYFSSLALNAVYFLTVAMLTRRHSCLCPQGRTLTWTARFTLIAHFLVTNK